MRAAVTIGGSCRWAERAIARRADGPLLTVAEAERLGRHLEICAPCRAYAARLEERASTLRAIAGEEIGNAPGRLAVAVLDRWDAESGALKRSGKDEALPWRPWLVAAPVAVAAVGGAFVLVTAGKNNVPTAGNMPFPAPIPKASVAASRPTRAALPPPSVAPVRITVAEKGGVVRQRAVLVPVKPAAVPPLMRPVIATPAAEQQDDLAFVNGGGVRSATFAAQWGGIGASDAERLQADIDRTVRTGDDFVSVPFPQVAAVGKGARAVGAEALNRYRQERAVVDARLMRRVTLAEKGVALSDLCAKLKADTGIEFSAGRNVADDKVTIFCKDRPLRDLMRAVAQLFSFAWERNGAEPQYQYRLFQPLRAQLLEEEMRNHDRNEALIALDKEMEQYRPLLGLSPEQARQLAASATGEAKDRYAALAGGGWGAVQLYHSLTPEQLAALRDGKSLKISAAEGPLGQLAPQVASGVLRSLEESVRVQVDASGKVRGVRIGGDITNVSGVPPSAIAGTVPHASLEIAATELGRFQLRGASGFSLPGGSGASSGGNLASGTSPTARDPKNAEANKTVARDPALQNKVTLPPPPVSNGERPATSDKAAVTTAELLEAFHRATGQDVIGDYYTRLLDPAQVWPGQTAAPAPAFDLLCKTADAARLRWERQEEWLTFRSIGFFNDRPKEVPARLLQRWSRAQAENGGALPLRSLTEIASLSDAQLDGAAMAEGARALHGLTQWEMVRSPEYRPTWRFLAALPPDLRQKACDARRGGLTFEDVMPDAQEAFARVFLGNSFRLTSAPESMPNATLLVEYPFRKREQGATKDKGDDQKAPPLARFTYRFHRSNARDGGDRAKLPFYRTTKVVTTDGDSRETHELVPPPAQP